MSVLKLGIPKGSLEDATIDLLGRAGWKVSISSRSYVPSIDDPEIDCLLVRAQEMARYVETGALDAGITGHDWVQETGADVIELAELVYAKQRLARVSWVLAVPEDCGIRSPRDLEGKVIATEVVGITRQYLAKHGVNARVEFSWGATEVKVPQLADAIVEVKRPDPRCERIACASSTPSSSRLPSSSSTATPRRIRPSAKKRKISS